ncbi:hypothetical protein LCGC14_2213000, partial [marine sediment metagenome]
YKKTDTYPMDLAKAISSKIRVDRDKVEIVLSNYTTCKGVTLKKLLAEHCIDGAKGLGEILDIVEAIAKADIIKIEEK